MKNWYPGKVKQIFYAYDRFDKIAARGAPFIATHIMAQTIDATDIAGIPRIFSKANWLFFKNKMNTKRK